MSKKPPRPEPSLTQDLRPLRDDCPHCGRLMWADYSNRRTIATLAGLTRLNLSVRRCHNPDCKAHLRPYRPEAEGRIALPRHEFGLDVVALAGALADAARLKRVLAGQGKVVLAIDGLQPDVGHEVLWVLRDCLSGEILLARSLLSSTATDLAGLITEVQTALPVPI